MPVKPPAPAPQIRTLQKDLERGKTEGTFANIISQKLAGPTTINQTEKVISPATNRTTDPYREAIWCTGHFTRLLYNTAMRFQVPQFIEVEDKIVGPLTIKQFIYIAGGVGMCFVLIRLLPTFLGILISIPVAVLAGALSFYKVNKKPFANVMESAFKYYFSEKLYIWKKEPRKMVQSSQAGDNSLLYVPKLADSKLKDMTWNLDVASKDILNPVTKSK